MVERTGGQALNDVSQGTQTGVDVFGLLESQTFGGRPLHPLTSSQVDQNQPRLNLLDLVVLTGPLVFAGLVDIDVQNGVTSARGLVHLLAGHGSVSHAGVDDVDGLFYSLDWDLHKLLDEDLSVVLLTDLEVLAFIRIEQILNLVLIDLVKTQVHMPLE